MSRPVVTLALAIATLGVSIPYGTSSGGLIHDVDLLEWLLSALAFLTGLGLLLDLWHPWRSRLHHYGVAFMVAGAIWTAIATYELMVPVHYTIPWRLGHAIPSFAWAVLALTTWRQIRVADKVDRAT